jgi:hypothetical protein
MTELNEDPITFVIVRPATDRSQAEVIVILDNFFASVAHRPDLRCCADAFASHWAKRRTLTLRIS